MMKQPTKTDAILALAPGAEFIMVDGAITEWHTFNIPQPSEAAIDAKLLELQARANVPASVTPRQVRLLLLSQGLLDDVQAMIAAQDQATRITWEFALEFRRDDPLLNALAANLGLTDQQIDDFFIAAAAL